MKQVFKRIIEGVLGSLDTTTQPFSARKLSAMVIVIMVIVTHVKWFKSEHWEYLAVVLGFDFTFILVCLGLATWQYMKKDTDSK